MVELIPKHPKEVDDIVRGYLECALWSSHGEDEDTGETWNYDERYTLADLAPEAIAKADADCLAFARYNALDIDGQDPAQIGHDFWLTRNHHGAGFWDSDYPKEIGERLTVSSEACGECDLYVGDDGKLYLDGGRDWSKVYEVTRP